MKNLYNLVDLSFGWLNEGGSTNSCILVEISLEFSNFFSIKISPKFGVQSVIYEKIVDRRKKSENRLPSATKIYFKSIKFVTKVNFHQLFSKRVNPPEKFKNKTKLMIDIFNKTSNFVVYKKQFFLLSSSPFYQKFLNLLITNKS